MFSIVLIFLDVLDSFDIFDETFDVFARQELDGGEVRDKKSASDRSKTPATIFYFIQR